MATKRSSPDAAKPLKTEKRVQRGVQSVWISTPIHSRLVLVQKLLAIEQLQRDPTAQPMTMGQITEEALKLHLKDVLEKHGLSLSVLGGLPKDP